LEDGEDLVNEREEEEEFEEEVNPTHFNRTSRGPHLGDWLSSPPLHKVNRGILSCLNLDYLGMATYPFPEARSKSQVEE